VRERQDQDEIGRQDNRQRDAAKPHQRWQCDAALERHQHEHDQGERQIERGTRGLHAQRFLVVAGPEETPIDRKEGCANPHGEARHAHQSW